MNDRDLFEPPEVRELAARRRETPAAYHQGGEYDNPRFHTRVVVPDGPLQALMEAAPFQEPERDATHYHALREAIATATEELSPEELYVFEACACRGASTRQVAVELGRSKSSVDRTKQRALRRLRELLVDDRVVRDHFYWKDDE